MEATQLDPGSYPGTYKLVGGRLSLDLVNTVSWPGTPREHDWLDSGPNVTRWASAAGIVDVAAGRGLDDRAPGIVRSELAEVRRIRGEIALALVPLAHRSAPTPEAVSTLNARLRELSAGRSVDPRTLRWTWARPTKLVDLVAPVVWDAGEVLTSSDHSRIGYCASCGWVFYDTTRNRSRRWCDMQDCGSRDKSLRYYHRTKPGARSHGDGA